MPSTSPTFEKSFVEKILEESLASFRLSEGAKVGDNVIGNILAIEATTADGREIHAVYKGMPPPNTPLFEFAVKSKLYRVESAVYEHVAPLIEAMLRQRDGSAAAAAPAPLPIPKCYSTMNDDQNDYLVLEDLRARGYIMPDKYLGLNLPETLMAAETLARLHAVTYWLIREEGEHLFTREGLDFLKNSMLRGKGSEFERTGVVMMKANLQNAIALLEEGGRRSAAQRLRDLLSDEHRLRRSMEATHEATDRTYFPCLVHGDLWVNNMLYRYEGGDRDRPLDLKLIDFQQSHRGNVFEDLGYFLLTSTTPEFRTAHLPRVLFAYHDAFVAQTRALDCPLPVRFSRGFLIDEFYENLPSAYVYMSFAVPMQLCEPGEAPFAEPLEGGGEVALPPLPSGWKVETLTEDDIAIILQAQYLLQQMRKSPRALRRWYDLSDEMMALNVL